VRAEAIIGDFYLWFMLRAIEHRLPDGSDRHVLDIGPVYQKKGLWARVSRATKVGPRAYRRFGPITTARRAVFSSDLTSMSKNEPWLLVFMALEANIQNLDI